MSDHTAQQEAPAAEPRRYGTVGWTAHDVMTLAPGLTEEQAERFLQSNHKHIQNRITEVGWDVLTSLLQYEGIKTGNPDE